MKQPRLIYCAGGNRQYAEIAIRHNFHYGAKLPDTVYFPPYFVDQEFRKPNREKYMAALAQHRPHLATIIDWMPTIDFDEVMSWANEASQHVKGAIIIVPKIPLSVAKIPDSINGVPIRLGYSIKTSLAGTPVQPYEFGNRQAHLLGGSPQEQIRMSKLLNAVSADGNYIQRLAGLCQFFTNGYASKAKNKYAPQLGEFGLGDIKQDAPQLAFELSCLNIRSAWAGSPALIRFANESDLHVVVKIARQYDKQLGYVRPISLREAIAKKSLLVAEMGGRVVGFVNYHARRDGWKTIYEIAVDPAFVSSKVGAGLLAAVPKPTRLKCVLTNIRANYFYSDNGMNLVRIEDGKRRSLAVWERIA